MSWTRDFVHGDAPVRVTCNARDGAHEVTVGDRRVPARARRLADGRVLVEVDGESHVAAAVRLDDGSVQVRVDGRTWLLPIHKPGRRGGAAATSGAVEAPMTGTVLDVAVKVGATVAPGDLIAVVTAMKMEHKLKAQIAGTVAEVAVAPGQIVAAGALIARIEPA